MHNFESNYEFRKFFRDEKNNDIESAEEFDQRVSAAYNDIQEKYGSKNVLIVAHSGTSRPLLRNAQNLDFDFAIYEMDGLENAKVIDLHNYKI
jgi:broad specificity phosphatase PhoE